MKYLLVVGDGVFPDQDCFVSNITMSEKALAENMQFLSYVAVLDQTFSSVLKRLFLRNFFVEKVSGVFEFLLNDREANRIENFFAKSFCPDRLNFGDEDFFLIEVPLFSSRFAPILPSSKLDTTSLSPVLLASMFKSQEHSLLKPGLGHNI